jgi:hypothetical protein
MFSIHTSQRPWAWAAASAPPPRVLRCRRRGSKVRLPPYRSSKFAQVGRAQRHRDRLDRTDRRARAKRQVPATRNGRGGSRHHLHEAARVRARHRVLAKQDFPGASRPISNPPEAARFWRRRSRLSASRAADSAASHHRIRRSAPKWRWTARYQPQRVASSAACTFKALSASVQSRCSILMPPHRLIGRSRTTRARESSPAHRRAWFAPRGRPARACIQVVASMQAVRRKVAVVVAQSGELAEQRCGRFSPRWRPWRARASNASAAASPASAASALSKRAPWRNHRSTARRGHAIPAPDYRHIRRQMSSNAASARGSRS